MYKRRFVPVFRDFPEGCGVFSGQKSNSGESLIQSKGILRAHRDLPELSNASNEGLDYNLSDVVAKGDESNGVVIDHEENKGIGESEVKQNAVRKKSSEKKRRLSLNDSTKEVQKNLVNTSKRVIVMGLAARSKCPWSQPKKRGSRKEKIKVDTLKMKN